jgi:hypothetical protein
VSTSSEGQHSDQVQSELLQSEGDKGSVQKESCISAMRTETVDPLVAIPAVDRVSTLTGDENPLALQTAAVNTEAVLHETATVVEVSTSSEGQHSDQVQKGDCCSNFNQGYITLQAELTIGSMHDQTFINNGEVNAMYEQGNAREFTYASTTTALTDGNAGNFPVGNESYQHKEGERTRIVAINDRQLSRGIQNLILIHEKEKTNVVNTTVFGEMNLGMVHREPGEENNVLSRDIMAEDAHEVVEKLGEIQVCESHENLWMSETGEGEKKDRNDASNVVDKSKTLWNASIQLPSEDNDDPNQFSTMDDEDEDDLRVGNIYEDEPTSSFLDPNESELDQRIRTQINMENEDEGRKVRGRSKRAVSKSWKKRCMDEDENDKEVENQNYYVPVAKPTTRKRTRNHEDEEYDPDINEESDEVSPRTRQRKGRRASKKVKYSGFGEIDDFNETITYTGRESPDEYADLSEDDEFSEKASYVARKSSSVTRKKKSSRKYSSSYDEYAESSEHDEFNEKVSHVARKSSSSTKRRKTSSARNDSANSEEFKERLKNPIAFIGNRIAKQFADKKYYFGSITTYDKKFWKVFYDDGDSEEFDKVDLELATLVYAAREDDDPFVMSKKQKKQKPKKATKPKAKAKATKPKSKTKAKRGRKKSTKSSQRAEESGYIETNMVYRNNDNSLPPNMPNDPASYKGVRVAKVFDEGAFYGQVTDYDRGRKLWHVTYDDGDMEEYNSRNLKDGLMLYIHKYQAMDYDAKG